ncbi:hypothetical protein QVD17_25744 [Tagetes erecta]|uniref:Uncharacterized protein n=1 Tax=Tagetes erecta TaxID=13708 RepID=A0AAD8NPF7_TARER|nr:hypothetical protein QVD17_25744 [Tagetes erecta]
MIGFILPKYCCSWCNFLLNGVLDKVLYLTQRREKYLVVAAVRFIRILIYIMMNILRIILLKTIIFVRKI